MYNCRCKLCLEFLLTAYNLSTCSIKLWPLITRTYKNKSKTAGLVIKINNTLIVLFLIFLWRRNSFSIKRVVKKSLDGIWVYQFFKTNMFISSMQKNKFIIIRMYDMKQTDLVKYIVLQSWEIIDYWDGFKPVPWACFNLIFRVIIKL